MKKYIKTLIIAIVAFVFLNQVNAQISTDMIKYWYYRNRLSNYFVVPGDQQGESQIICVRNTIYAGNDADDLITRGKSVDYGQHGKYQGLYLGVLATEYYLLNKNGQYADAAKTQDELYKALNAVKVYWDEKAEDLLILNKY